MRVFADTSVRQRGALALTIAAAVAGATAAQALAATAPAESAYIVELKAPPVASYKGGRDGMAATSPSVTGQRRVDSRSAAARRYRSYLDDRQHAALARVPGTTPVVRYAYRTAFSGFAAQLTPAQVAELRKAPEVAHVYPDRKRKIQDVDPSDPDSTEAALDGTIGDSAGYLDLPHGLWAGLGNADDGAGDGTVVGVIDTGIIPSHPSFAATGGDGTNFWGADFGAPPAGFTGTCETPVVCTNKLVAARHYVAGFGADNIATDAHNSPIDDEGHGSHTAATAAGNFGVDPEILDHDLGVDLISGIAPRARVAAYKVCWVGDEGVDDGCFDEDSIAAIEDAVDDGVDVINYSVGGTESNVLDALEKAFLGADDAGVFVANSAGNSGPDAGTLGTPTTVPWITSVAAESAARTFEATATVHPSSGPDVVVSGASVTGALPATAIVDAADVPAAGATSEDAELCQPGTLDEDAVDGKVVLCLRGVNDRIEKSKVVADAGGVGMILYNPTDGQDTDTDTHYVPSVHVSHGDGLEVKAAIAGGGATAAISAGATTTNPTPYPRIAAFSSRGPQGAVPDLPKPDVTAPGVNILAANTDAPSANTGLPSGELFQSISGTSMASPHVAGAGALLAQAHPDWTPAEIKSALMLTGKPVQNEDGTADATPFDSGSGEIDPNAATGSGLVLDVDPADYRAYIDGFDPTVFDDGQEPIAPSDLNIASIGNAAVTGVFSTSRTVTANGDGSWNATIAVDGFDTSVTAASSGTSAFTLADGGSEALAITAARTDAPFGEWAFGTLTLTRTAPSPQTLHIPISLQPVPVDAPATQAAETTSSSGSAPALDVTSGFTGTLGAVGWGLAEPQFKPGRQIETIPADTDPTPNAPSASQKVYDVTVPAGSQLLSGRISNADGDKDVGTDLDLYLLYDADDDGTYDLATEVYDASASTIADEGVTEVAPPPGHYRFLVVGFATQNPTTYDFTTWVGTDTTPDDPSGGPGIEVTGDPFTVGVGDVVHPTIEWSGVDDPGLYLGVATFHDAAPATLANARGATVFELTRKPGPPPTDTTSTTTTTTSTTTTTAAAPPPPPQVFPVKPPKPAVAHPTPTVTNVTTRLSGRRLTLGLKLNRRSAVTIRIKRGGHTYLTSKRRAVPAGLKSLHVTTPKLRPGSYRVTVTITVGSRHATRTVTLRVR